MDSGSFDYNGRQAKFVARSVSVFFVADAQLFMPVSVSGLREFFAAMFALVRQFAAVDAQMVTQVAELRKRHMAYGALKNLVETLRLVVHFVVESVFTHAFRRLRLDRVTSVLRRQCLATFLWEALLQEP